MLIYKLVNIPNFEGIKKELSSKISLYFKDITELNSSFYYADTNLIKKECPLLIQYLNSCNLTHRWAHTGISVLNHKKSLKIHTDAPQRKERFYALNIPIINCENSFTIWYHHKHDNAPLYKIDHGDNKIHYEEFEDDDMVEIKRISSDNPAFVNIKLPHRGINTNELPRCLISLRFIPELTTEEISLF